MKKIITISREFGAGGGEIGRKVAERLGSVSYTHLDLRLVDFFVAFFKKNTLDRYRMWVYYQHMNNRSNVCRKRVET